MPRRVPCAVFALTLIAGSVGCVRRDGRNSACKWPGESPLHAPTARHLSADAEFAEDLAIRYSDTHYGLHSPGFISPEAYASARNTCTQAMFAAVAREHGVPASEVRNSLGRNRAGIDTAEYLPFLIAYCLAAFFTARMIWRRNAPAEVGWIPGFVMLLLVSIMFALLATMMGETWGGFAETLRVGTAHMSNRLERVLWARHRLAEFIGLLALFLLAAAECGRRVFLELPRADASQPQSDRATTC